MMSRRTKKDEEEIDERRKITPMMIMEHTGEDLLHDVNCLVLRGMNLSEFDSPEYVLDFSLTEKPTISHDNNNNRTTKSLSSLETLSLSHNKFDVMDTFMNRSFSCGLKSLNLNFNFVGVLPDALRLPNLEALYLSQNFLVSLPEEFYKCVPKLETLCLFENRLESLPKTLASIRNLTGD